MAMRSNKGETTELLTFQLLSCLLIVLLSVFICLLSELQRLLHTSITSINRVLILIILF
jgi:hypothetical protein